MPTINTRAVPLGIPPINGSLDLQKALLEGLCHLKVVQRILSPSRGKRLQQGPAGFGEDMGTEALPAPAPWLPATVIRRIYSSILIRLLQALPLQPVAFAGKQHES